MGDKWELQGTIWVNRYLKTWVCLKCRCWWFNPVNNNSQILGDRYPRYRFPSETKPERDNSYKCINEECPKRKRVFRHYDSKDKLIEEAEYIE